jgi:hypothetical protein
MPYFHLTFGVQDRTAKSRSQQRLRSLVAPMPHFSDDKDEAPEDRGRDGDRSPLAEGRASHALGSSDSDSIQGDQDRGEYVPLR